jgi:hypothetical protein
MITLLIYLLVVIVVFGGLIYIIRLLPFEGWVKQAGIIVVAIIFFIVLLVYILLPLLHMAPAPPGMG